MVRYKNRYFVTELELRDRPPHAPISITNNRLRNCIFNKVGEIHGDFGVAAITTGFRIKYCNPCTKIVLIRCRHGPHRIVGTVLPLIKMVDDHKVQFNLLHVGSTIKKSFKFIRVSVNLEIVRPPLTLQLMGYYFLF